VIDGASRSARERVAGFRLQRWQRYTGGRWTVRNLQISAFMINGLRGQAPCINEGVRT